MSSIASQLPLDILLCIVELLDSTPGSGLDTFLSCLLVNKHWNESLSSVQNVFWRSRLVKEFGLDRLPDARNKYMIQRRLTKGYCSKRLLLHGEDSQGKVFAAWPSEPSDAYLIAIEDEFMFWLDQRIPTRISVFDLKDELACRKSPLDEIIWSPLTILRHPQGVNPGSNTIGLILGNKHGKIVSFDEASRVVVWEPCRLENGVNQICLIDAFPILQSSIFSMNVSKDKIATGGRGGKVVIWNLQGECLWFMDVSNVMNYRLEEDDVPSPLFNSPLTLMNVALNQDNLVVSLEDGGWWCWDLSKIPKYTGEPIGFDCNQAIVTVGWTRSNAMAKTWWQTKRQELVRGLIMELEKRHGGNLDLDLEGLTLEEEDWTTSSHYAPMTLCLGTHFLVTNGGNGNDVIVWDMIGDLDPNHRMALLAKDLTQAEPKKPSPPGRYPLLIPNAPGRTLANFASEPCIRGSMTQGFNIYKLPPSNEETMDWERELLHCLKSKIPHRLGHGLPARPKVLSLKDVKPETCRATPKCTNCDEMEITSERGHRRHGCDCSCHSHEYAFSELKFAEMGHGMDCILASIRGSCRLTVHGKMQRWRYLMSDEELERTRDRWTQEFNALPTPPSTDRLNIREQTPASGFMVWDFSDKKRTWSKICVEPEHDEDWPAAHLPMPLFEVWIGREL